MTVEEVFAGWAETAPVRRLLEPQEVAALLNDYFGYFAVAAESCGGTVDKFIGDCIMIVFGVPDEHQHHALHAMTCGMLIQRLTGRIKGPFQLTVSALNPIAAATAA